MNLSRTTFRNGPVLPHKVGSRRCPAPRRLYRRRCRKGCLLRDDAFAEEADAGTGVDDPAVGGLQQRTGANVWSSWKVAAILPGVRNGWHIPFSQGKCADLHSGGVPFSPVICPLKY